MIDGIRMAHEPERSRFVAHIDEADADAVVEYRPLGASTLEYYRTFTPVALRGRGIGRQLVAYALDYALANGLSVVPSCPFVAKIIAEEANYADLPRRAR